MNGNPRCDKCHGRGIVRTTYGYATCVCVRGIQAQRNMQRDSNAPRPGEPGYERYLYAQLKLLHAKGKL